MSPWGLLSFKPPHNLSPDFSYPQILPMFRFYLFYVLRPMNFYVHPLFLYLLFTLLSFLFIVFEYPNYALSLHLHGENTVHTFSKKNITSFGISKALRSLTSLMVLIGGNPISSSRKKTISYQTKK